MNKSRIIGITATVLALALLLCLVASHPPVFSDMQIPGNYMEAIQSQAKGVYSKKLPFVPIYINVDSFSGETVFYTIHYFPIGTVGISYHQNDGYNIEKALTR